MEITLEQLKDKLTNDHRWIERAIIVLYHNQTHDEQILQETSHHNGVGFSGSDANFMSSLARQIEENRYNRPLGSRLTQNQFNALFTTKNGSRVSKVAKYARQIYQNYIVPGIRSSVVC